MIDSAAVLLSQSLELSLGRREYTDPVGGQALIEVEWAGVCGSDLHVLRTGDWVRDWPATPGHEIVGLVSQCPDDEFAPGTRVVIDSRVACGQCHGCTRSANRCEQLAWVGEAFSGGLQERMIVPARLLVPAPADLEPELAVLAEPLAVAQHAVSKVRDFGDSALLIGYGPIGMLIHAALSLQVPEMPVTVAEPNAARQEIAAAFGADVKSPPRGSVVFEASGHSTAFAQALTLVDNGGEVVIVALGHAVEGILPAQIAEKGISIHGSNGFDMELPGALATLAQWPERFRALITDAYPLADAPAVLAAALANPVPGKLVFRP